MIKKNNLAEYENNKNLVSKLLYKRLERIKNKNKFSIIKKLKKSKNFVYGKKFQNFLDFTRINKYYSLKFSLGSLTKEKNKYRGSKELRLLIDFFKKKNY